MTEIIVSDCFWPCVVAFMAGIAFMGGLFAVILRPGPGS